MGKVIFLLQERALGEALCFFMEYGLLLLQHHRKLFTPKNKQAFEKLDYLLRYVHKLDLKMLFELRF